MSRYDCYFYYFTHKEVRIREFAFLTEVLLFKQSKELVVIDTQDFHLQTQDRNTLSTLLFE